MLQWSRPQLRTETTLATPISYFHFRASMEPSSAEDGNQTAVVLKAAVKMLQWSRPQLRTETGRHAGRISHKIRFNGAVLS